MYEEYSWYSITVPRTHQSDFLGALFSPRLIHACCHEKRVKSRCGTHGFLDVPDALARIACPRFPSFDACGTIPGGLTDISFLSCMRIWFVEDVHPQCGFLSCAFQSSLFPNCSVASISYPEFCSLTLHAHAVVAGTF